jgi:hypothetical protein
VHDLGGDFFRDRGDPVSRAILPELVGLEALEQLRITAGAPFASGIPAAWLRPGAFPRLKELSLWAHSLSTPLPDFEPGMLPALELLSLDFAKQDDRLPASWGRPDVLPRLRELKVYLGNVTALPESWAAGFRQLTSLRVQAASRVYPPVDLSQNKAAAPEEAHGLQLHELPAAWGHGFPMLRTLELSSGATGTIPPAWLAGFPSLTSVDLSANRLTGPLPPQLFSNASNLGTVYLSRNRFTGALPDEYAYAAVKALVLDKNSLSGPAFPAAWLEADALLKLEHLDLSYNQRLSGTLPANLSWPHLQILNIVDTGVRGTVPAAWCQSPFANSF